MINVQMFSMSQLAVEIFNENPGAFGKVHLEMTYIISPSQGFSMLLIFFKEGVLVKLF